MIFRMRTIILGLFLLPSFLLGGEKKMSDAERRKCEEDAKEFRRMAQSFGGKMLFPDEKDEKPKPSLTKITDKQSKL